MGTALTLLVLGGVAALLAVALDVTRGGPGARPAAARSVALPLLAASGLLAAAGLVLTLVVSDETLGATDAPVLAWLLVHRDPTATTAAEVLSLVGGTAGTGGAAVVAALVLLLRGRRARAVVWVVGVVAGASTIRFVKVAVERPRPPVPTRLAVETTSSLPSGHSLMAALGLGLVALAAGTLAGRAVRVVVTALAVLAVAAIGASRAYLGVHWITDVIAGWLLGAGIAMTCLAAARAIEIHPPRHSPVKEAGNA